MPIATFDSNKQKIKTSYVFGLIWLSYVLVYAGEPIWLAITAGISQLVPSFLLTLWLMWILQGRLDRPVKKYQGILPLILWGLLFALAWTAIGFAMMGWVGDVLFEGEIEKQFKTNL